MLDSEAVETALHVTWKLVRAGICNEGRKDGRGVELNDGGFENLRLGKAFGQLFYRDEELVSTSRPPACGKEG